MREVSTPSPSDAAVGQLLERARHWRAHDDRERVGPELLEQFEATPDGQPRNDELVLGDGCVKPRAEAARVAEVDRVDESRLVRGRDGLVVRQPLDAHVGGPPTRVLNRLAQEPRHDVARRVIRPRDGGLPAGDPAARPEPQRRNLVVIDARRNARTLADVEEHLAWVVAADRRARDHDGSDVRAAPCVRGAPHRPPPA